MGEKAVLDVLPLRETDEPARIRVIADASWKEMWVSFGLNVLSSSVDRAVGISRQDPLLRLSALHADQGALRRRHLFVVHLFRFFCFFCFFCFFLLSDNLLPLVKKCPDVTFSPDFHVSVARIPCLEELQSRQDLLNPQLREIAWLSVWFVLGDEQDILWIGGE